MHCTKWYPALTRPVFTKRHRVCVCCRRWRWAVTASTWWLAGTAAWLRCGAPTTSSCSTPTPRVTAPSAPSPSHTTTSKYTGLAQDTYSRETATKSYRLIAYGWLWKCKITFALVKYLWNMWPGLFTYMPRHVWHIIWVFVNSGINALNNKNMQVWVD